MIENEEGNKMKIALIACVSKKNPYTCPAKDLYISSLFKSSYSFAKKIGVDKIFILSAEYHLVEEDRELPPYENTLNDKNTAYIKKWAEEVKKQLREKTDVEHDEFIILAGEKYRKYIVDILTNKCIPLEGKRIGEQLSYLKQMITGEQK